MENIFYQFTPHVFAANYGANSLLLDLKRDEYFSFGKQQTQSLQHILSHSFHVERGLLTPIKEKGKNTFPEKKNILNKRNLHNSIKEFKEKNWIEECQNSDKRKNIFATPLSTNGLKNRYWNMSERAAPNQVILPLALEAFGLLLKASRTLRKKGIQGLKTLLEEESVHKPNLFARFKKPIEPNVLANALDVACMFYPQKINCLPWAGALALLLLRHKKKCDFVIGVQIMPFFAHAWVEVQGKVINDSTELQSALAPILKLSLH